MSSCTKAKWAMHVNIQSKACVFKLEQKQIIISAVDVATQITREEAEDILKEGGTRRSGTLKFLIMKVWTNQPLFVTASGCSCASLRVATLFNDPDPNRSNFVAEVDAEKCVGCGACVEKL